ncbi:TetR/AcrR family transcriptional regulator [Propionibacterium sp.]|uniref:TetR/AcrR family transcriptional regulator n=1 Tax=Propionibacterium sp. TaxID=1977903 RepID=UPI0039E91809
MAEQSRRRAETRERLIAAALELIRERSLSSATVEAVSERAGFTRGAFYSNFASMDDLLVAVFEKYAEELIPVGEPVVVHSEGVPTEHRLVLGVAERLLTIPVDREWFFITREMAALAARRPDARRPVLAFSVQVRARIVSILTEELDALGLRPTLDLDSLATAVVAIFEAWQEREYLDNVPHETASQACATSVAALLVGATQPLEASTVAG